jgi:type III secretion protein U
VGGARKESNHAQAAAEEEESRGEEESRDAEKEDEEERAPLSKTEEPTPKRLRKAAEDGQTPLSTFASQSVAFLCAVAVAPAAVTALTTRVSVDLRGAIASAAEPAPTLSFDTAALASGILLASAPILAAAAVAAGVASAVQTGGVIATKKLAPNLERLNPIAGARQLFSPERAFAVARAGAFAIAVAWIARSVLVPHLADLARGTGQLDGVLRLASTLTMDLVKRAALVGLVLGALDIVITRRSWRNRLRMSKEEVKREHKESEGDPQLKAARERAHQELLASAMIANVKKASVVIVNPVHLACALRYDETDGDEAPVLVASGHGDLARRLVEAAHHYGVPVLRDVPLARALIELHVGDEIPEALYEAVAEILREAAEDLPRPVELPPSRKFQR